MNTDILKDLEDIVNKGLENTAFPLVKGKSIRIKNYIVRQSKVGYLVYNTKENKQVAKTNFKSSAIAIAKTLASGNDKNLYKLLDCDKNLTKHVNDAVFFKNIIKKTNNNFVRESRKIRLDISIAKSINIKNEIDSFIFDN